ncbi:MAG TPA: MFS transporter [Burkholderiaceae bacterium]|nr:MFS transporter [Burkholderiaceae bacterium]
MSALASASADEQSPSRSRVLWSACAAHALHDGYTDLIYVLLPLWQKEFAIGYATLALMRGLYAGAMACLQFPAALLAERRLGGRSTLAIGTVLAAAGYLLLGFSGSLLGVAGALVLSGAGASVQHPIGSAAVARAYAPRARGALGTYNFSGDLGKAAIPAAISLLLAVMPWREAVRIIAVPGFVVAGGLLIGLPRLQGAKEDHVRKAARPQRRGFWILFTIGLLDTAVRMGLLTFLPFLLAAKGASQPLIGLALALVFLGGAAGKITCGWLGARAGVLWTILLTEGGTAAAILACIALPLVPAMVLLPVLGLMLNGTSSVLYGSVPEFSPPSRAERAFAVFYTGNIGSGALSPVLYGVLGDAVGPVWATAATAATAATILPLAIVLAAVSRIEDREDA